jgi:hypothetical protein
MALVGYIADSMELLHRSFITPLERGDLRRLILALDEVVDYLDDATRRIALYEGHALRQRRHRAVVGGRTRGRWQQSAFCFKTFWEQTDSPSSLVRCFMLPILRNRKNR